ncbi:hypothetical protein [Falsibacillus pallidus]|uniref:hypothetical protein n=1 Tax=Falsibacillus pallidus TaxID=493781 RepID=UPI003D968181
MGKNKFFTGMLVGAVAGGLVTLFDRSTRESVSTSIKSGSQKVWDSVSNPQELLAQSKELYSKSSAALHQMKDDLQYINETVEEVKKLTPRIKRMVSETKDTFEHSAEKYKEVLVEDHVENNNEYTGS